MTIPPRQVTILSCLLLLFYFLVHPSDFAGGYLVNTIIKIVVGLSMVWISIFYLGHIIQRCIKKKLTNVERTSLAIAAFFIGFPAVMYGVYLVTHHIYEFFPAYMVTIVFLVSIGTGAYGERNEPEIFSLHNSVLIRSMAIFILFIAILVFWYQALPDSDPYGWIQTLQPQFDKHILPPITERPLFASFLYIGVSLLRIDLFTFLKYIFPFIPLTILAPLWLIAKQIPGSAYKTVFLLYLLGVPSTALYITTPTPQVLLIIVAVYAVVFILYSKITGNILYFYTAGAILLSSFLYHQAAILLFIPWLVGTLVAFRKSLLSDWKNIAIITLLVMLSREQLRIMVNFVVYWIHRTYYQLFEHDNTNFLYPAQYVNIDHNQMGWPGLIGVTKFYLYYSSPIVIFVLLVSLGIFIRSSRINSLSFIRKKEHAILISALFLFLLIAETLPRYPNIALLPERAWVFISILTLPLFFLIATRLKSQKSKIIFILIASVFLIIGMAGTIYINSLKRYLISPEQITSAKWIQKNLPKDKLIYGYNNSNLIIYHSKSQYISFRENILCSRLSLQDTLEYLEFPAESSALPVTSDDQLAIAKGIPVNPAAEKITITKDTQRFVYFAPKDNRNPYNERGYHPENWGVANCNDGKFLFDRYPHNFKRIYNIDGIVIWKYMSPHANRRR